MKTGPNALVPVASLPMMLARARRGVLRAVQRSCMGVARASTAADADGEELKKKTLMLTVAYLGTNYHGIQYDPHGPAAGRAPIENVLEQAAHRAGFVSEHNVGDAQKLGIWRACRTDKGVHARSNVVRIKLQVPPVFDEYGHSEPIVAAMNAQLPDDVRVIAANKASKTMCPRNLTSHREYHYLLSDQALREARIDVRAVDAALGQFCGSHFFVNYTRIRMRNYLSAADMDRLRAEQEVRRQRAAAEEAAAAAGESGGDAGDTGDAGDEPGGSPFELLPTTGQAYPRQVYNDQHFVRHVFRCGIDPAPVSAGGCSMWRVRVVGTSFMYHQIRKMVAAALLVGSGAMPPSVIAATFLPDRPLRMHVPLAPAHPLLLSGPSLVPTAEAAQLPSAGRGQLRREDWGPVLAWPGSAVRRLQAFTDEVLVPHVAGAVCGTHLDEMREFLHAVRAEVPSWVSAAQPAFEDSLARHREAEAEALERQQRYLELELRERGSLDGVDARDLLGPQFLPRLAVRLGLLPGVQLQRAKEGVVRSIRSGVIPHTWAQAALLDWAQGVGAEALGAMAAES